GRVILLAGPLDAEGGTLPVNPDFVPLVHELIYRLADPSSDGLPNRPGEAIRIDLAESPAPDRTFATVTRPDGTTENAPILREGPKARVRLEDTGEPGIYRIALPGPSGGTAFASVASDGRETEPDPLDPAEAKRLSEGWPLSIETDPNRLNTRLLSSSGGGPRPLWRWLVLAALGGLCFEVFMTRQLVQSRGMTGAEEGGA
ncbi:MAG: N-terminal double-transrane protein, partial [Planctomycetota bacterium]|nr:N-terminal double-transrane protein [Planctomycetota bacterium]